MLKEWSEHLEIVNPVKDRLAQQFYAAESRMEVVFTDPVFAQNGYNPVRIDGDVSENHFIESFCDYSLLYTISRENAMKNKNPLFVSFFILFFV